MNRKRLINYVGPSIEFINQFVMKKRFIIYGILIFSFMYQPIQAQTKEETISWLKEKIERYKRKYGSGYSMPTIESMNECELVMKYNRGSEEKIWASYTVIIPTNGVLIDGDGDLRNRNESIRVVQNIIPNGNTSMDYFKRSSIDIANGESNLYERIARGFAHLNRYCPVKKNLFRLRLQKVNFAI